MCVYTDREIKQKRQNINNYSIQMLNVLCFFVNLKFSKLKVGEESDRNITRKFQIKKISYETLAKQFQIARLLVNVASSGQNFQTFTTLILKVCFHQIKKLFQFQCCRKSYFLHSTASGSLSILCLTNYATATS